jgi:predicted phage tail protein
LNFVSNISNKRELVLIILTMVLIPSILFLIIPNAQAASVPDPPTGFSAIPISPTSVSFNWFAPQNNGSSPITGYIIEYKITTSSYSTLITLGNVTKYNGTSLATGKTYIFRVSAINSIGTSQPSSEVVATPTSNSKPPQHIPPNPPTGLAATSNSLTQINLSWNPPTSNAGPPVTGYKIQFSIDSGIFTDLVSNSASTSTSYSHTGVSSHTYTYKVYAINSVGTSNSSNIVSAVPTQVKSAPYTPTGLSAIAASPTSISLSWVTPSTDGGSPIIGYKIEAKIGSGTYIILVANTASSSTSYLNTGLIAGSTYTYRVSAINSIGTSNPSNEAYTTPTKTFVPTGVTAIAFSPTEIDLSWVAPSETYGQPIAGYKIEQKFSSGIFDTIVDNTGMTTSYAIKNLQTGKTYTFVVTALFTGGGQSNTSIEVSATPISTSRPPTTTSTTPSTTTPQLLAVPDPPTNLNVTKASASSVQLYWNAPSSNGKPPVTGYKVEFKVGSGSYSVLTTNTGTTTSYFHTGLFANTYTYRVSAINSAGTGNPSTEASIILVNNNPPPPVIESSGGTLPVTNTNYSIGYNIVGGKILGTSVSPETFSLQIQLESKTGGSLSLNLPRGLIDAKKADGSDDIYLISASNQILKFNETRTNDVRTVAISFPIGIDEISIYGTHVVPEFSIVPLVLVVALISVMIFSRKLIRL